MNRAHWALRLTLVIAGLGLIAIMLALGAEQQNSLAAPNDCPPPPAPPATPVPFLIEPVWSPTTLLEQTLYISLWDGRAVTVDSEAGAVTLTRTFDIGRPVPMQIPLLPRTTHHLTASGLVEYSAGCFYTLTTHNDRYGRPLIIVQITPTLYLPLVIDGGGSTLVGP